MDRDNDETLVDIKFAHDILDPSIAPEAHTCALDQGHMHIHVGEDVDSPARSDAFWGGVATFCFISFAFLASYGGWVIWLSK